MAHQGRKTAKKAAAASTRQGVWIAVGALAVLGVAAAAVLTMGGGGDAGGEGVSFPDVHGIAVDRGDPSGLYVATHVGLIRGEGDRGWRYVGDARDDFMGFSAHPTDPDVFWASGHPARRTGSPNLGLIKSEDAGRTWTQVGAAGMDFHALAVSPADPDRMWGFHAGKLHGSGDGGATWRVVHEMPPQVFGLAGHPTEADVLFAGSQAGVRRSDDGGTTWSAPFSEGPTYGVAVDPAAPDVAFAAAGTGVLRSDDGGETWRRLPLVVDGLLAYVTVSPHDGRVVYAATGDGGIHKSEDGGESWRQVRAPSR